MVCAGDVPLITSSGESILRPGAWAPVTAKFWTDTSKMIIKFVRNLSWIGY